MKRVVFICTHNSARSQMAEGLLNHSRRGGYRASSAGTAPTRVHPLAVRVMAEAGIDISGQRSKPVDELRGDEFDYAVTVCDDARERCPAFWGAAQYLHWSLPDPSRSEGGEAERLAAFRKVRDRLIGLIDDTFTEEKA